MQSPRMAGRLALIAAASMLVPDVAHAQGARRPGASEQIATIEDRTSGFKKLDGFFPLYWDEAAGRLYLEIPRLDTEVLLSTGLGTGLGSNDIGLDRGILTGARIVNGRLDNMPFASSDTYDIAIDAQGTAVLPFLTFQNTLRVRVRLTQALPGGVTVTRIQHLFFKECYGELGRMVSSPGDANPSFTSAAEFRRLAL